MLQFFVNLDRSILLWIQEFLREPILNPVFVFITSLGNLGIIWIVISVSLFISKKTRKVGFLCFMALLGSVFVNNVILKNLVGRIRPYEVIPTLHLLVSKASDYSFPSGHTATAFASAYILYKELPKKYGVLAMIIAVLIGYSRLYVGIHYPSDVLGGFIVGMASAMGVRKLFYIWISSDKMSKIKEMLCIL